MSTHEDDLSLALQSCMGVERKNLGKSPLSDKEMSRYKKEMEKLCPTPERLLAALKEAEVHEREVERGIVILGGKGIGLQAALGISNSRNSSIVNVPIKDKPHTSFSTGRGGKSLSASIAIALTTVSSSLYKETLVLSDSFESRSSKGSRRRNKQNKYRGPYG